MKFHKGKGKVVEIETFFFSLQIFTIKMVDSVFLPVHPSPPWSVHRTLICSSAVSLCLLKAGTPQDCQYWSHLL